MSIQPTLARPYARAAFEYAREHGELAAFSRQLAHAAVVAGLPEVAALIGHPKVARESVLELLLEPGQSIDTPFGRLLRILAENGRLGLLADIAALYELLRAEAENVLDVKVRAAAALDEDQHRRLAEALRRRFGRDIRLHVTIDPGLLAGAVVDAQGLVIDGSLRARLDRLRHELMH